ncbi:relaxin receptor 1-like [Anabrus simplex]|uniref:relaxin receptor 1-like n=1 Tax=Anabrus simplex TaxID=316456 RepID=UPI0035A294A7
MPHAENNEFKCPFGLHPCSNANVCIPQAMNCDGHRDCPNGSDELDCNDEVGSLYYDHLFPKRPLGDTEAETVHCDFNDAGSSCLCGGNKVLCDNLQLTQVPDSVADSEFTDIERTTSRGQKENEGILIKAEDEQEEEDQGEDDEEEYGREEEVHTIQRPLKARPCPEVRDPDSEDQELVVMIHMIQRENEELGIDNQSLRNEISRFQKKKDAVLSFESFSQAPSLHTLVVSLSENPVAKHRYLDNNELTELPDAMFPEDNRITELYLDSFQQCSNVPHVRVCEPHGDGISSQDHLLDSVILRVSVWIVAALACVINLVVLVGRILMGEPNAVHSLYIMNLAISDFFMGFYLFIIAVADYQFRGIYLSCEYSWRRSITCTFAGVLNTLSSVSSIMILVLITWDRLICVVKPLAPRQSLKSGVYITCGLWCVALFMSLLPLTGVFGDEFYGGNGVCVPLQFHNAFAEGWIYSTLLFAVFNSAALAFIVCAYSFMFFVIRSSGLSVRSTQERREGAIARRFAVIVLTDCTCWVPIIITKLMALRGESVPQELYGWLAVIIMPVNAALNPVFFTLTTKTFKEKILELICSLNCGRIRMPEDDINMSVNPAPKLHRRNMRRTGVFQVTLFDLEDIVDIHC